MPGEDPNDMQSQSGSSRPDPSDQSGANAQTEPADEDKGTISRKLKDAKEKLTGS